MRIDLETKKINESLLIAILSSNTKCPVAKMDCLLVKIHRATHGSQE